MAQKRTDGKRYAVAIAALLILSSCNQQQYGFSDGAADGTAVVPTGTDTLVVRIELDEGYAAAEEFTQRVTLRQGESAQERLQGDLTEPFVFTLGTGFETATLQVVIGFCDIRTKEICFVSNETLTLAAESAGTDRLASGEFLIRYRPEPPKL